ncbi:hypothetical protein K469DRAFT_661412 [Zopfia rhizophila CBS 207.26]|uniref:Clr5 domain-containing protein n=1 Tax=Zopfia rhizophila CBS 207.26 TaxID=1314779 RepID=A0A6A6EB39_9PEZI|nr:hypothetical protein K469DRAFT_661412 [Zopfia rhizophila CBS 207.26]
MPAGRPSINIDPYQLELIGLFKEGLTYKQLSQYLRDEYEVKVTDRTIKTRFREWKIGRRLPLDVSTTLKARILVLFFKVGLEDKEILYELRQEGFDISKYILV